MKTKSSYNDKDLVLGQLAEPELKEFLLDSVNLPDPIDRPRNRPAFERWLRRWQRLFTFQAEDPTSPSAKWITHRIPREQLHDFAPRLNVALRRIWLERDPRQRDWYFYKVRDTYHHLVVRAENPHIPSITDVDVVKQLKQIERVSKLRGDNPVQRIHSLQGAMGDLLFDYVPQMCPVEAALYWLQNNQNLMLRCGSEMCPAPYFFRAKKGQKYCSPECADPARKDSKRRWWRENRGTLSNQAE